MGRERIEQRVADAKAQAELMQAWLDGKPIQYRGVGTYGKWATIYPTSPVPPAFTFELYEYRIKREPRVLYANEYPGGRLRPHNTRELADRFASRRRVGLVKFVEVIE